MLDKNFINNPLLILRDEINKIDTKIVKILSKRKYLVLKIAQSKIKNNQKIRDLEREKKMLEKLIYLGKQHNLDPRYITQLFELIIKESILTQKKLLQKFSENHTFDSCKFSFLGPKGSFSHIAVSEYANKKFKICIEKEYKTFKEVVESVETNKSDYAMLPIENNSSGYIIEVLDLLKNTSLFIVGEINIFINHCLLGIKKIKLNEIKIVYSHLQPFKQCSNFIKNFPNWKIKHTTSTTDAMETIIKHNEIQSVALGSEIGGKLYGLNILQKNLSNQEKNVTRFVLLQKNPIKVSEKIQAKTTLMFIIEKRSKNLSKILLILKEKKIAIKKLTSYQIHNNYQEETFYIDIKMNLSATSMQNIIKKIEKITKYLKFLGCYPIDDAIF